MTQAVSHYHFLKNVSVDLLTEQQTHTWTLLQTAVTSNTSAQEYCLFFFHSLLQNIIDFVSFAIPRLHCRQYCLIRLPDYASSEWRGNGERTMTRLGLLRNAAEENYFRNISRRCDILVMLRHQQPERLLRSVRVFVCLSLYWSSIITDLIS